MRPWEIDEYIHARLAVATTLVERYSYTSPGCGREIAAGTDTPASRSESALVVRQTRTTLG
jgi:hypothetical protein